ncbi:CHAT domain-containing protein [Phormidesmis sp. 146-12]
MAQYFALMITVLLCLVITPQLIAQPVTAPQLVQQGRQLYERGPFEQALKSWQRATEAYGKDTIGVTGSLIDQAQAWSAMGHQRQACKTLVQALQPGSSATALCDAVRTGASTIQSTVMPVELRAIGLRNLGKVLRLIGNLEASQQVLLQSLELSSPKERGTVLLRLGNTAQDLGSRDRDRRDNIILTATSGTACLMSNSASDAMSYYKQALDCYQAADSAQQSITSVQAPLNHLSLLLEIEQWLRRNDRLTDANSWLTQLQPQIVELIEKLPAQIDRLPNTHETFFAQINFARSLTQFYRLQNLESTHPKWQQIQQRLQEVATQARAMGNQRAEGYAIANLGWFYEQIGQLPAALAQTEQALKLVQSLQAPDINYQWEWQRGRILARQNSDRAIQAYESAVQALQLTRGDLIAVNPDAQFSLRDTVEPIYREYISLLLPVGKNPAQENLEKSLRLIDSLQLTELENFFRCNLLQARQVRVDQTEDPTAAVIHTIILDDRIEIILKLPQQTKLTRQTSLVKRSELEQQLAWFREQLKDRSSGADVQKTAQLVYGWLLRSLEPSLEASKIKTLVFVLDGSLRGIPMAALYDGQRYLIEKYAVAITPGLQLLGAKRSHAQSTRSVLIAGLTTGSTITVGDRSIRFSPLANVLREVQQIRALLPQSQVLLDSQFTTEKFRNQVSSSSYAIVHVATHGRFSSNPDETFILTASAQPVDVNELQTILQNRSQAQSAPVELLVFSACETAVGDKRAALGLAGVAIRAGAFSTLASLWAVDDASTSSLMGQFYRAFSQGNQISKADALRRAQLSLLYGKEIAPTADLPKSITEDNAETDADFSHPYFWTPFVLVGDWL